MSERRRAARTPASGLAALVRPGYRVEVVDVSSGGALFDAARPLRPGAVVDVQFERAEARLRLSATVVRCGVIAIDAERGPTYRAAVSFRESFPWAREASTHDGYELPESAGVRTMTGSGLGK